MGKIKQKDIKCNQKRCKMNQKGYKGNCCYFPDIRCCENSPIYDKYIADKSRGDGDLILN